MILEKEADQSQGTQFGFFLRMMVSHLRERVAQYDLHFGKITLAALWRVECGGAGVEAGRPVKKLFQFI